MSPISHRPPYIDQGAQWNDIVDGNGSADANGTVDSNTPGIYQITYSATDTAGNEAEPVVRTIQVVDSQAPVITLTRRQQYYPRGRTGICGCRGKME